MVNKEVSYNLRYFLLIVFLFFTDLYSKNLALHNLLYGQSENTFLPIIDLLLIYNSGIAFGIFDNAGLGISSILLVITILILIYLLWMIFNEKDMHIKTSLSIITGGAIGNIYDRAMDGKVTDFLHLEILNNSFFVFNLADAFITIGAVLIIYFEIIKKLKNE